VGAQHLFEAGGVRRATPPVHTTATLVA